MKKDTTHTVIIVGIVLLLLVSVVGTVLVLRAVSSIGKETEIVGSQAQGTVSLTVVDPNEAELEPSSDDAQGTVTFTVVDSEEAS